MAEDMVKAVVVRGSYTLVDKDGNPRHVHPNQGEDSKVLVPARHLEVFSDTLVREGDLKAATARIAAEKGGPLGANDATSEGEADESAGKQRSKQR